MLKVAASPNVLRWARERAGLDISSLRKEFPRLELWERGESIPTLKQLENLSKKVHVPIGYLFLTKPPEERIPIPDLRTMGSRSFGPPSPNLLDVIYLCQRRQVWYRDYALYVGEEPRSFVGSLNVNAPVESTAELIRNILGFNLEERRTCPTWTDALRLFIKQAEGIGVLVMVSGVVGSNTHRKLNPEEFRGFALADDRAPLVFINGTDTKAAQMFSLAHELAHLWLGESALSNQSPDNPTNASTQSIERWCNQVAAELLVPINAVRQALPSTRPLDSVQGLARKFKVSTLVILRRIFDAGRISWDAFQDAYNQELVNLRKIQKSPKSSGGDFYLTREAQASRRFVQALIISTLEGHTLYREAFQLLGIKNEKTFAEFGNRIGVRV